MENRFKLADSFIASLSPVAELYNNIWFENSTCLLHAPLSLDKSTLAVDIALSITERDVPVFYLAANRLNTGLLDKMKGNRRLYVHQSEFATPDDPDDFADIVFRDLEDAIAQTDAKVFIIDSLSRISALSFGRNASPTFLMKRLVALQVRHKISILVLAHDASKAAIRALVNLADCELTMAEPDDSPVEETKSDAREAEKEAKPAPTPVKPEADKSKSDKVNTGGCFRVPDSYSPFWDGPDTYKFM